VPQCPQGTRACLWEDDQQGYDRKTDRVIRIIPLATENIRVIPLATEDKLSVQYKALTGDQEGLNLILHGPAYPPTTDLSEDVQDQSLDMDIICPPNGADSGPPTFHSYDGKAVKIQWRHRVACSGENGSAAQTQRSPLFVVQEEGGSNFL
jgi:hypothetical protein